MWTTWTLEAAAPEGHDPVAHPVRPWRSRTVGPKTGLGDPNHRTLGKLRAVQLFNGAQIEESIVVGAAGAASSRCSSRGSPIEARH